MLASIPASILNQNRPDLGIPNRFRIKSSRFSRLDVRSRRVDGSFGDRNNMEYLGAPGFVLSLIVTLAAYVFLIIVSRGRSTTAS